MSKYPEGFYTYLWLREDGTPYYVGKGKKNRAFLRGRHRLSPPYVPDERIIIQAFECEEDAFFAEKFLIALYGREDLGEGRLLNLTDGGENPPPAKKGLGKGRRLSEEHKKSISKGLMGHTVSEEARKSLSRPCKEETKRKIAASNKGKENIFKGKKRSAEFGKKISEAKKGHTVSLETRSKISKTLKERGAYV